MKTISNLRGQKCSLVKRKFIRITKLIQPKVWLETKLMENGKW